MRCQRPIALIREIAIALSAWAFLALACPGHAFADKAPVRGVQFAIPHWFKNSFLDLKEDAAEAGAQGKRLLLYIGQDGCPYCAALFNTNFSQKPIVDYARTHFDAIELNLWGDRPVLDVDGESMTEKTFAAKHQIWFTPTIIFFDAQATSVLRINGYYPPRRFIAALRYAAGESGKDEPFSAYLERVAPPTASGTLHDESFFEKPPHDLRARKDARPIVVLFEQRDCDECDALHREVLARSDTRAQLAHFRAIQLDRWSATPVTTPEGENLSTREWADRLGVAYLPSLIFFDEGKEVMRVEAMLKAFHVQSVMDYVASGAYRAQPSFQRFIQTRAEHLRDGGTVVDLWK